MPAVLRVLPTIVMLLAGSALGDEPPAAGTAGRTLADPYDTFSIAFPSDWRSRPLADGEWGEVGLFADRPHEISILVGSRPLRPAEARLDSEALLDHLIERTLALVAALGNEIVRVGRTESVVDGWPAFAAVATNADRSKMMTILRTPVGPRLYVVATLTDNLEASPELAARVSEVVASLEIRRP